MKTKKIAVFLAAVLAVSAFSVPAAADDDVVTITYWGWDSNYYEPMFNAYMESHPNVVIEATATEWGDMLTKAQQALASGSEVATLIPMDISLIGNWKQMGIMDNLLDYGLDTSVYNPALIEAATNEEGELIGLFENVCPSGIAYKRDLALEYLGTDDPDELSEMLSTYDDYVEIGQQVAEASDGEVYLFHSGQAVAEWLYFASDIPNVTDDTINMTDKMTDIMTTLIALRDAGAVDTYQNGTAEANATYADDTHIFYPCPDWALTYYIEVNDPEGSGNWGLIQAPVGYSHGGTALGIYSGASDEEKEAAYDFITWAISSEEGATIARDEAGYITQDSTIATDDFCKRSDEAFFGGEDISTLYYVDIASIISIASPSAYDNDVISVRDDVAQLVMNDSSMSVDDAVAASLEEIESLVTDDSVTIQ